MSRDSADNAQTIETDNPPSQADFHDLSALCVDDDVLVAMDGVALLEAMGFGKVYSAFSFRDAAYVTDHQDFHFALLDIDLGGGWTSLDLARRLTEAGTLVVFTSGQRYAHVIVSDLKVPVIDKPCTLPALRKAFDLAFAQSKIKGVRQLGH